MDPSLKESSSFSVPSTERSKQNRTKQEKCGLGVNKDAFTLGARTPRLAVVPVPKCGTDLADRHRIRHWHQSAHNVCECPDILPAILCSNCQHGRRRNQRRYSTRIASVALNVNRAGARSGYVLGHPVWTWPKSLILPNFSEVSLLARLRSKLNIKR